MTDAELRAQVKNLRAALNECYDHTRLDAIDGFPIDRDTMIFYIRRTVINAITKKKKDRPL